MRALHQIGEIVHKASGIAVETLGRTTLERAVYRRMTEIGQDSTEQYIQLLVCNPGEIQYLLEALVVPETWFFRDPHAFSFAVQYAQAHVRGQRAVRILSLPCSTGEEPYSIAMALLDAGWSPESFRIDGLDISNREIDWAKRAIYGRNSFRGADLVFRDRYFVANPEGYGLRAQVRDCVQFEQGNLFAPEFSRGRGLYDIIFCRNLLIYFDSVMQARALQILATILADGGLIFGGPSEASIFHASGFESLRAPKTFAFQRSKGADMPINRNRTLRIPPLLVERSRTFAAPSPRMAAPLSVQTETRSDVSVERATRLADDGALSEAREVCEQYLREHGPSAQIFYLLGLVKDAEQEHEGARECYRKALYLNPDHYESLVQLALLNEQEGNLVLASAFRGRAERAKTRIHQSEHTE